MMSRVSTFLAIAIVSLATTAFAEKASMSPKQLYDTATHVVVGKVLGIYKRIETKGDWKYTHYIAEIRVERSEKWDNDAPVGRLLYARYWKRGWIGRGRPEPTTSGHRGLPNTEDTIRVYLARNAYDGFTTSNHDGGFNVIGANGFERIKKGIHSEVTEDASEPN